MLLKQFFKPAQIESLATSSFKIVKQLNKNTDNKNVKIYELKSL